MKNTLICPNCRHEIDVEKVLFDQIASQQSAEIQRKRQELEALMAEKESVLQEKEAELKNRIATQEEVLNSKMKEREVQLNEKLRLEISDNLRLARGQTDHITI